MRLRRSVVRPPAAKRARWCAFACRGVLGRLGPAGRSLGLYRPLRRSPWSPLTGLLTARVSNFRQMWRRLQIYDLVAVFGAQGRNRTTDTVIFSHGTMRGCG
jgi:hypothetical protein